MARSSKKTYPDISGGDNSSPVAGAQLRAFFERIERMQEEKKAIAEDIREIFAEAKGNGFDTKIMRQVIKLRKMEPADRNEQDELLDLYRKALAL